MTLAGTTIEQATPYTPAVGVHALRDAAVLTTSYVASKHMPWKAGSKAVVRLTYDSLDYTTIEVMQQSSTDGTTFADHELHVVTLANQVAADDGVVDLDIGAAPAGCLFGRSQIKRTGGTAVGTVAADGRVGG